MLARGKERIRPMLVRAAARLRGNPRPLAPQLWGLDVTPEGSVTYEGLDLARLRSRFGSPLHLVFATRLRANAMSFLCASTSGRSRADVLYSYKTNPVPAVLESLHECGLGAEVISEHELWLARRLGVPAGRIVYNGPAKSPRSVREAIEHGVLLNLNHREEISLLAALARAAGCRPRVGVRITVSSGWAQQFGSPVADGSAMRTVREARATGVLEVVALHSHVGGQVRSYDQVHRHVVEVLAFADELHRELGLDLDVLDFGGSLATPTVGEVSAVDRWLEMKLHTPLPAPKPELTLPVESYVRCVLDTVERHYSGRRTPRVVLEPGKAVTGSAQALIASVLSVKAAKPLPWAILDAGINLAESRRSAYHEIFPASRMHARRDHLYRLAGPICSPGDVICWAAPLPELSSGDALTIMDTGAYFIPFSTSFSFPRPAIVMLESGEPRLLRRAEAHEDLVGLDLTHPVRG